MKVDKRRFAAWMERTLEWGVIALGATFVLLAVTIAGCLAAEPGADPGEANIFSLPPEANQNQPAFRLGPRAGQTREQLVPGFEQLKQIPSLTPRQRQQLRQLYESARAELRPKLQELKGPGKGAAPAGQSRRRTQQFDGPVEPPAEPGEGEAMQAEFMGEGMPGGPMDFPRLDDSRERAKTRNEWRERARQKRQELWQQAQGILTETQLREFELMKKGQLYAR